MSNISIIKWGNRYTESYTYGSEIILNKSSVYFSSPMMPVGAKIKSWYSKGSYSINRVSPLLPLLIGGKNYQLALFLEKNERNCFQVTIEFFDEFDNEIAIEYFNELKFNFTYPVDAVSYRISLINKKHEYIKFYFMMISDIPVTEVNEVLVNEDFTIMDFTSDFSKNEIEVVIDNLVRETTMITKSNVEKNYLYLFLNQHDKNNFVKSIVALVKYLERYNSEIRILPGNNFEQSPSCQKLLPYVLTMLYSEGEREITTDIPFPDLEQNGCDIQTLLQEIKQTLLADGIKLSGK